MKSDGDTRLGARERAAIQAIDAALLEELIAPFSSPEGSRFIAHAGNPLAVDALERTLAVRQLRMVRRVSRRFFLNGHAGYNVIAELGGSTKELVIVGAHLDSTGGDRPLSHPAPGVDDDASGMAAVLAIAQTMKVLADGETPKRAIQFAFFNAEEVGCIGSKQYARNLAGRRARVVAMIELDSIGYCPAGEPHCWEVHAGHADAATQARSAEIAGVIVEQGRLLAEAALLPPAIITEPLTGGRYAASDHVSFQDRGFPACVVTQGHGSGPGNRNPHIHSARDTLDNLNLGYTAAITRAVAATVWTLANR